jgi:hypothetical protein
MDVVEIIKELRQELERIDSLILALDMLQSGRRRGRPPKLLQQLRAARADAPDVSAIPARKKVKKGRKKTAAKRGRKSTKKKAADSPSQG